MNIVFFVFFCAAGLVWNALHPNMHGLPDIPASEGLPSSWLAGDFFFESA